MAILKKPYTLAVYGDILQSDGSFAEERICIIGSDKMQSQSRALEPNLIRNVNGQNKFSFKMYKKYVDVTTGEKVENPFTEWLVSERKVKLHYDGKWYDFVIKDIAENSSDYLYTYSLEDANVQELSKNGFGVTLDAELMNNIGSAEELGKYVMEETDWNVSNSDVSVQTIEEALVYVVLPADTWAWHLLDQNSSNLSVGAVPESTRVNLGGQTVLAFYSSCKNRPHRFQFIYANGGDYGKNADGSYKISCKDNRIINEKNCQYYIDFNNPEGDYQAPNLNQNSLNYDLYLPEGFIVKSMTGGSITDTSISTWYRGARYGFSQQAVYVPLLERYCQKFTKSRDITLSNALKFFSLEGNFSGSPSLSNGIVTYTKAGKYAGFYFDIEYDSTEVYDLSYIVTINSGNIVSLGGHALSFEISKFNVYKVTLEGEKIKTKTKLNITQQTNGCIYDLPDDQGAGSYLVEATYKKIDGNGDVYPYIYVQPNIYKEGTSQVFTITNIDFKIKSLYYGYADTEYISPTLIQNCITNYNFKSSSGWTATQSNKITSNVKPSAEGVYGRFVTSTEKQNNQDVTTTSFKTIVDDYLDGGYSDTITYKSYMKMEFRAANQFVLNSGIRDNRTMIGNMPEDEEWVLDYRIVNSSNVPVSNNFGVSLKEFIYNKDTGAYDERSVIMEFSNRDLTAEELAKVPTGITRKIFKVTKNEYEEDQFKGKNGKGGNHVNLQLVSPTGDSYTTDANGNVVPVVYYIEHIALYRKSVDKNGDIIVPDYEAEESKAAQNYVDNSTLENKYNYFNAWHVDGANPRKCTDKEALPLSTTTTLKYDVYKPVYNTGAQKIRSVSVKESNYFNILQSIAETFEQWLVINVERDENTGAITSKNISFKNYRGDNNYACFRYGVNLKDIQRTYTSKNIVTKLIVKANSNQLGKDGFCTIQRAGANPTGENYIYDFQYYQNTGLMDVNNYLTTNYYLNGAVGNDATLWTGEVTTPSGTQQININGYFPRLKKINDALLPLNEEIIGLRADLVQEEAKKEVAEAQKEAASSGIEQTRLDFQALTGAYPEEAQSGVINSVGIPTITMQSPAYEVDTTTATGFTNGVKVEGNQVQVRIKRSDEYREVDAEVKNNRTVLTELTSGAKKIQSNGGTEGLYVTSDWSTYNDVGENSTTYRTYVLTYELKCLEGTLQNIGCHHHYFKNVTISVKNSAGNEVGTAVTTTAANGATVYPLGSKISNNTTYFVTITATRASQEEVTSPWEDNLWIQPNRGVAGQTTCVIDKIKLVKKLFKNEQATNKDEKINFYLQATLTLGSAPGTYTLNRTMDCSHTMTAGTVGTTVATVTVTSVDTSRSDVKKYLQELTTYRQSYNEAVNTLTTVEPIITAKQNAIDNKNRLREQYLEWKKQLNKIFFQRYCRFIQEGTWISEEYADDEKYYADAQSVMYNSCYPQVAYTINVLELSQLPGYELFKFDLGDKTQVIDDEFFGEDYREEVIITELSEMLDDPSKNTIKVQNFKNQFQDLFQKITATVQQTQYNVGSYEKGAAFLQASEQKKSEFITNAINNAKSYLSAGQTVESGPAGITITDDSDKKRQLRLVGGAILFSAEDPETKETKWRTGLTNEGISADLITAGRLDAGAVQIMSGDDPVFRWDAYGISAYDARWDDSNGTSIIDSINTNKFVRFDKHGIYGINSAGVDGQTWHPNSINEIDQKATFALTWEGLKVTGNEGVVARLGKLDGSIFKITNGSQTIIDVQNNGVSKIGSMEIGDIASKDDVQNGLNLARSNAIGYFSQGYGVTLTSSEYHYTITNVNTSNPNAGLQIGSSSQKIFTTGKKYVVSYKFSVISAAFTITEIAGHIGNFTVNKAIVDGELVAEGARYDEGYILKDNSLGKTHTVELYVTCNKEDGDYPGIYIQPHRSDASTDDTMQFIVWDLKVEEGEIATKWITPYEDQMQNNSVGSYSWQFSPTQGIKMWNGAQTDTNKVFSIDSQNGLQVKGNGEFTGTIKAGKGNIGGWTIDYLRSGYSQQHEIGLFKKGTDYCSGMAAKGDGGSVAFWAGCPGGTPWEVTDYNTKTGFFVTESGFVHCSDIEATGGTIGPFKISDNALIYKADQEESTSVDEGSKKGYYFVTISKFGLRIGYIVQQAGWNKAESTYGRWTMTFTEIGTDFTTPRRISIETRKTGKNNKEPYKDTLWNNLTAGQVVEVLAKNSYILGGTDATTRRVAYE